MAVHLYLNHRVGYGPTRPVALILTVRRHRARGPRITTPFRVAPRDWSVTHERLKPSATGAVELNATLARLRSLAETLLAEGASDEEIRARLKERMGTAPAADASPGGASLLALYDAFKAEKATHTRASTLEVYEALRGHLEAFAGAGGTPADVGPDFLDRFARHLTRRGLANTTVNKLLTRLKGFLSWLAVRGHLERRPEAKPLPTARNPALYLSAAELARLIALDLSGHQPGYGAARDLFVAGAVTGQRYGDLQAMTWAQLDAARTSWHLPSQKTSTTIQVPLAGPVRRLLSARAGERTPLPRLSNQKANAYLKEVCRLAEIETPVSVQVLRGGQRETSTRPKHECITTHAARKTFVTLALQSGTPVSELLGFTHDDLRTLRRYAGQSEEGRRGHVERTFGAL